MYVYVYMYIYTYIHVYIHICNNPTVELSFAFLCQDSDREAKQINTRNKHKTYGRRKLFCIDYRVPLCIPVSMLGTLGHTIFNMYVHHPSGCKIQSQH